MLVDLPRGLVVEKDTDSPIGIIGYSTFHLLRRRDGRTRHVRRSLLRCSDQLHYPPNPICYCFFPSRFLERRGTPSFAREEDFGSHGRSSVQ